MKKKLQKIKSQAYHYGFQLVAVGSLTGVFAGTVITLYQILTSSAESLSRDLYAYVRQNPLFLPLLFLALFLGAIVVGGVVRFIPMIRGSGIPQTEGATRGLLRFRWYEVLTGMFAASLLTIFLGLSAGSEGPSILIGGACGDAVAKLTKRGEAVRRYQITGGACTGFAVAFNAPLTGMAFAFEEAHKRFTPEVFVCSFSSVIVGVITRNLLRSAFGLPVGASLTAFSLVNLQPIAYLYVLLASVVCGLLGVGFYKLIFWARKRMDGLRFWKGTGKMLIPFLVAGVFGLITPYAMGGGHELIESLGSGGVLHTVFSSPIWLTLFIVLVLKLIATTLNIGAGVPCGAFVPMLAIGACAGALLSLLCVQMGMDQAYCDLLVLICMATFFTTVVKSPITAIVMVLELTWSFTYLTPVILGVAVGYLVGDIFRTEPAYERILDEMLKEERAKSPLYELTVRLCVEKGTPAEGRAVRDVLWPSDALVVSIVHDGETVMPNGGTVLYSGDEILVRGKTVDRERFCQLLTTAVGEQLSVEEKPVDEE